MFSYLHMHENPFFSMTSLSDNPNTVLPQPQQSLLPEVAVSQLSCGSSF